MATPSQRIIHRIGGHQTTANSPFSIACPAEIDFSNADPQLGSSLLSRLPAEIRTSIFEYALTPDPDPQHPYLADRVYWRPDLQHHPRTSPALLRTCKAVYREARLMPVAQATHHFWILGGPFRILRNGIAGMTRWDSWQASLTPEQRRAVQHVHVFAQQVYLEDSGSLPNIRPWTFATKNLRLTFRHSDWWSWQSPPESSDRLGICPWLRWRTSHQEMLAQPLVVSPDRLRSARGTWGWHIGQVEGLQRLEIEFETDVVKKEQLDLVLERARYWMFPLAGRPAVLVQSGDVVESTWEGPADMKDDNSFPLLRRRQSMTSFAREQARPQRTYFVAVMTWKAVSETNEEYLEKIAGIDEGGDGTGTVNEELRSLAITR